MISPLFADQFFARGDGGDGHGLFYAHQIDRWCEIWCYGEHPDYDWAYVFRGTLQQIDPSTRWVGRYFAVPKGRRCDAGEFVLETTHSFGERIVIARTDGSPGHESAWLSGFIPVMARPIEDQLPGFQGSGTLNLSGLWSALSMINML